MSERGSKHEDGVIVKYATAIRRASVLGKVSEPSQLPENKETEEKIAEVTTEATDEKTDAA